MAAYYHDIGKMLNPRFFTENQRDGENPHDKLGARESAEIIINHVVDGARLAAKHKLPRIVADFIPQHHGSSLIAYFYDKALEGGAKSVDRADFSYKGSRPNSRETGIMMIVDAVEAASRALREVTPKSVERMVQHVVFSKLLYGQLDESELTVPELKTISLTLVDAIMHARHERVKYPWQKEEEKQAAAAAATAPPATASGAVARVPAGDNSGRVAVPPGAPTPHPSGAVPVSEVSSGAVETPLGAGRISYPKNGAPSEEPTAAADEPEAASG